MQMIPRRKHGQMQENDRVPRPDVAMLLHNPQASGSLGEMGKHSLKIPRAARSARILFRAEKFSYVWPGSSFPPIHVILNS